MLLNLFFWDTRAPQSIDDDNDDMGDHRASQPAMDTGGPASRTIFGSRGCNIYGYPSSGGIFVKKADVLDLLYLSPSRSQACERSPDSDEEDKFCASLQRVGAKWWISKQDWINAILGARDLTDEESKVVVYGWPTEGAGVWVLRYGSEDDVPYDFGRLRLALTMEKRIVIMQEYNAEIAEDAFQVPELRDCYRNESSGRIAKT